MPRKRDEEEEEEEGRGGGEEREKKRKLTKRRPHLAGKSEGDSIRLVYRVFFFYSPHIAFYLRGRLREMNNISQKLFRLFRVRVSKQDATEIVFDRDVLRVNYRVFFFCVWYWVVRRSSEDGEEKVEDEEERESRDEKRNERERKRIQFTTLEADALEWKVADPIGGRGDRFLTIRSRSYLLLLHLLLLLVFIFFFFFFFFLAFGCCSWSGMRLSPQK